MQQGRSSIFLVACCSMWDLILRPGIEPRLPALGVWSLSHWTTREVPVLFCSYQPSAVLQAEQGWSVQQQSRWPLSKEARLKLSLGPDRGGLVWSVRVRTRDPLQCAYGAQTLLPRDEAQSTPRTPHPSSLISCAGIQGPPLQGQL